MLKMAETVKITVLDKTDALVAALAFGTKEVLFAYKERWVYRLKGSEQIPYAEHNPPVYGSYTDVSDWAVSENIKDILDWLDKFEEAKK